MRVRTLQTLIAATLAAAALALLFGYAKSEPRYCGLRLSYCLRAIAHGPTAKADNVYCAFKTLDTNAIPYLIDWIQYERPAWRTRLAKRVFSMGPGVLFASVADWIGRSRRLELANGSASAFFILRDRGEPAIEPLGAMINDPKAPQTAYRAIDALTAIGTATSLNKLITSIADPKHPYREQILDAVEMAFHNDSFPVPLDQSSISNAPASSGPRREYQRAAWVGTRSGVGTLCTGTEEFNAESSELLRQVFF